MSSREHASIDKGIICYFSVRDIFPQISNASAAPDPFVHPLFEIPRCYDFVAFEQQDFGRSGDGMDLLLPLKIGQLLGVSRG